LRALDARLAELERHIRPSPRGLSVLGQVSGCCDAAGAVVASVEGGAGGCACCAAPS
jgi:hypothetical protein